MELPENHVIAAFWSSVGKSSKASQGSLREPLPSSEEELSDVLAIVVLSLKTEVLALDLIIYNIREMASTFRSL